MPAKSMILPMINSASPHAADKVANACPNRHHHDLEQATGQVAHRLSGDLEQAAADITITSPGDGCGDDIPCKPTDKDADQLAATFNCHESPLSLRTANFAKWSGISAQVRHQIGYQPIQRAYLPVIGLGDLYSDFLV